MFSAVEEINAIINRVWDRVKKLAKENEELKIEIASLKYQNEILRNAIKELMAFSRGE